MPAGATAPRNTFTSGALTRTYQAGVVASAPGWEIRGDITRNAELAGATVPPDVVVRAFAVLVDPSQVDENDRDYNSGTRSSTIPGGGEDTSDAAAEARFFELADQIATELPAPATPPSP